MFSNTSERSRLGRKPYCSQFVGFPEILPRVNVKGVDLFLAGLSRIADQVIVQRLGKRCFIQRSGANWATFTRICSRNARCHAARRSSLVG